jgi:adenosylcobinamide-phosphate synthase
MTILFWTTAALPAGFILDAIFGDPYRFPHIVRFMGKLITSLEKLLRKLLPKTPRGEKLGGILLVCIVTLICTGIPLIVLYASYKHSPVLGFILESFLCYQLLAAKSLKTESMKVYYSLESGDIEEARKNISMIVGRDTAELDNAGITKAAIETVSENTSDGIVAPLMYMMLGGAVPGCLYKAVNTMDSMVGYKNDKYIHFGRAAAKTDDALNFIPSRICALLMVVAARLLKLDWKNAVRIRRRDGRKHASPNSAQTEAVCAGALGIELAGPASYHGTVIDKPYIGDRTRPVRNDDIKSANRLMYATSILALILVLSVRVIIWGVAVFGAL